MIATLIAETTAPGPTVHEGKDEGRPPMARDPEARLHLSALVYGLIDARACHIDFFDTLGGQEVERWYRRHHHPGRRHLHR